MEARVTVPLIENEPDLERILSAPTAELLGALAAWQGDLLLLGAGGKIGPSLAAMARRALPPRALPPRLPPTRYGPS